MKTTPTASLVFGATTLVRPGVPGGNGRRDPSDTHLLCTWVGNCFCCVALRHTGERYALVHDRRAASIVGGRMVAIVLMGKRGICPALYLSTIRRCRRLRTLCLCHPGLYLLLVKANFASAAASLRTDPTTAHFLQPKTTVKRFEAVAMGGAGITPTSRIWVRHLRESVASDHPERLAHHWRDLSAEVTPARVDRKVWSRAGAKLRRYRVVLAESARDSVFPIFGTSHSGTGDREVRSDNRQRAPSFTDSHRQLGRRKRSEKPLVVLRNRYRKVLIRNELVISWTLRLLI